MQPHPKQPPLICVAPTSLSLWCCPDHTQGPTMQGADTQSSQQSMRTKCVHEALLSSSYPHTRAWGTAQLL